ncbi:MAG TPA: 3-(cis-5,6-dihydroxycyclohexa-1,3-dien-1-yl)propanoate dehydrogenase [Solirubrobacteraceae bacterium]
MSGWLDGRRALLVGAGSGIGRAVLDRFLAEGAQVAVLERDAAKAAAIVRALPHVPVVVGDASRHAPNAEAVEAAVASFGGLDVLVSCVGVFDYYRSIEDVEPDDIDDAFDEVFHTNVRSYLHSVKAALPALKRSRSAAIVLTASSSAYYPGRGGVLYVSSKFAVRGLVTALAHDLAPDVRVNAVAPGGTIGTDLRGVHSLGSAQRSLGDTPDRSEEIAARVALRVALCGEDHAWSYAFLASTHTRGMTGESLRSDGGMSVSGAPRKRS